MFKSAVCAAVAALGSGSRGGSGVSGGRLSSRWLPLGLVLAAAMCAMSGAAQGVTVDIGAAAFPGGGSTANSFPMNTPNRAYATIWTPTQLNNNSGPITQFGWLFTGAVNSSWPSAKYWIGETTVSANPGTGATFMSHFNAGAPALLVYDGPLTITTAAAQEFNSQILTAHYNYSGQNNLYLYVEVSARTGTGASHQNYQTMNPVLPNFRLFDAGGLPHGTVPTGSSTNYGMGARFVFSPQTPLINTPSLPVAEANVPYSVTMSAIGGANAGYTWSLATGSLPSGITLSPSGLLSGTPPAAAISATPYSFSITATDATGSDTKPFTILVPPLSLVTTSGPLPPSLVAVGYSQSIQVQGGLQSRTWSLASGSLPSGLTLNSATGEISGTPASTSLAQSPYSFSVSVTDTGTVVTGNYSIEVRPPFIEYGTGTTTNVSGTPIYRSSTTSSFTRSIAQTLYTAADLAGMPSGAGITKIAYNKTNNGASRLPQATLRVWLANTTETGYSTTATFGQAKTGATPFFESTTYAMPDTIGWIEIENNTPFSFVYGGDSLMILVEWDDTAIGSPFTINAGSFSWRNNAYSGTSRGRGYASSTAYTDSTSLGTTTNAVNTRHPHLRIEFNPPTPFDADFGLITFGGAALPKVGSNTVTATVVNNGTNTLNGASLHLQYSINGGTAVTETFTGGAGLSPGGGSQTFNFTAPWVVAAPGINTVEVRFTTQIAGDPDQPANDVVSFLSEPDLDMTSVVVTTANANVGSNSVRVTLVNSGTFSFAGYPIPLRYTTNGGASWVTDTLTPGATTLHTTNSSTTFTFATPWDITARGSYTVSAEIFPIVSGDPDTQDAATRTYPSAGYSEFLYQLGNTIATGRSPIRRSSSTDTIKVSRYQMRYTPTELAGLPALSRINGADFWKFNAGATTGPGAILRVWLKNSPDFLPYSGAADWTSELAGAVNIFDSNNFEVPADTGWMSLGGNNQNASFFYEGGSIDVFVEWDCTGVNGGAGNPTTDGFQWYYNSRTGSATDSLIRVSTSTVPFTGTSSLIQTSSTEYASINRLRLYYVAPAADDADIVSVTTGDGMIGPGSNTIVVTVENGGTNSRNGAIGLEYSADGTLWTTQNFTATTLATLGSRETFTFTAPLPVAALGTTTLQVRFAPQVTGDPDSPAADTVTRVFRPDLDIVSVRQFPAGIPRVGSNTVRATLRNAGDVRLQGAQFSLSYAIDAGTPVTQSFTAVGLNLTDDTEVFEFTTPWNLAAVTPSLTIALNMPVQVTGDLDADESFQLNYTEAGILRVEISPPNAPEVSSIASGLPLNTGWHDQRFQSLIMASDLQASGFRRFAPITSLDLKVAGLAGMDMLNFRIRMQHTTDALGPTAFTPSGWTLVHGPETVMLSSLTVGQWRSFSFHTPFIWNGVDNVYVDFTTDGIAFTGSGGIFVRSTLTPRSRGAYSDSGFIWPFDTMTTAFSASYVPSMRWSFTLPPDTDLDVVSVGLNSNGAVVGSNQVNVSVQNAGLLSRTGNPIQLQYSTDGVIWVSQSFTPAALADGSTEVFTFTQALSLANASPVTVYARIFPSLSGDPDATDELSKSFVRDLDLMATVAGGGVPDLGSNNVEFTLRNAGDFDFSAESITMFYRVDLGSTIGTPVTETFSLAAIATSGASNTYTFTAPWSISQNRLYTLTVGVVTQLQGDPDTSESISLVYPVNVPFVEYNPGGLTATSSTFPIVRASATSTIDWSFIRKTYTAEMLGLPPGAQISGLSFFKTDVSGTNGPGAKLRVYLRNTDLLNLTTNVTYPYSTFFDGMTLVYESNDFVVAPLAGWMPIGPFNRDPFIYTGGNLEIGVDWDCSLVNGGATDPTTGAFTFRAEIFVSQSNMGTGVGSSLSSQPQPTSTGSVNGVNTGVRQQHMRVEYFAESPSVVHTRLPAAQAGAAYAFQLEAKGGTGVGYAFGLGANSDPLPAGLTLNPSTGQINGTPTAGTHGVYQLVIAVSDSLTSVGTRSYAFTVAAFADDFSTDKGWAPTSDTPALANVWSRANSWAAATGKPMVFDATPSSDNFIIGTNLPLASGFPVSMATPTYIVSPAIDLTGFTTASLSWSEVVYIINPNQRGVEISLDNGATWPIVWGTTHSTSANSWFRNWNARTLDISQAAGFSQVRLRFGYQYTSTSSTYTGYFIDDVVVTGTSGFSFKTPKELGVIGQNQNRLQPGVLKIEANDGPSGAPFYILTGGNLPPGMTLGTTGHFLGDATASGNYTFTVTAQSGASSISREFTLVVASSDVLWTDDFSQNRGWTLDQQWERGSPLGFDGREPLNDNSPTADNYAMGTMMGGYLFGFTGMPLTYITSPVLNLTMAAPVTITWNEWIYLTTVNQRTVEVRADGGSWQTVLTETNAVTGTATAVWQPRSVTITPQLGNQPIAQIRFGVLFTGTSQIYTGRYIDDVSITGEIATPLDVTTTSLPAGMEGAAYTATLSKSGGVTGVNPVWAIDASSVDGLPAGLTLNPSTGEISGTPAVNGGSYGTRTITFSATTAPLPATLKTLTLTIDLVPLSVTTETLPSGQEESLYGPVTLAAAGGLGSGRVWSIASGVLPPGLTLTAGTGEISGTPTGLGTSFGTYNVTFQVTDTVLTTTRLLPITINLIPLVIQTSALPTATETIGYSAALVATGGKGTWEFSLGTGGANLPLGLSFAPDGRSIIGTPAFGSQGSYGLVLQASDGVLTDTKSLTLIVNFNTLSVVTSSLPVGVEGVAYSAQLTGNGGTNSHLWTLVSGSLPSGLTMSPSGLISGTPPINGASRGSYTLGLSMTDSVATGLAAATSSLSLTINLSPVQITTTSLPNGMEATAYSASLAATGGLGTYTWTVAQGSVDQLPTGLTLSTAGVISGIPAARGGSAGTRIITFQAHDGDLAPVTAPLQLTINFAPLSVVTATLPSGMEGNEYTATLVGDGGGAVHTWAVAAGSAHQLPTGLILDQQTGVISGTPAINNQSAGVRNIMFQVSDGNVTPATRVLTLTIVLRPFVVVTDSLPPTTEGSNYSQQVEVTGGTGTYAFSITSGTLPSGLTLGPATGLVSGTPALGSFGVYNFTVRVADGVNTAILRPLSINVLLPGLQFVTQSMDAAVEMTPYSMQLVGAGGLGTFTWSLDAGSVDALPQGLTLAASTGLISGTPAGPGISARSYNLTFRLADGIVAPVTQQFTLVVSLAPLALNTNTLATATIGMSYTGTLAPFGGTGNYSHTLTAGSLPPGIGFNSSSGAVLGVPSVDLAVGAYTALGLATYNFTIRLSDGTTNVTKAFSISVQIQPLVINTNTIPSGTEGNAYTTTLSGSGGRGTPTWSLAPGNSLPSGLTLSSGGVISGTPALNGQSYGTHTVTVQLNDGGLAPATKPLSLVIALRPIVPATTTIAAATVGAAYSTALSVSGGTGSFSWSVSGSSANPLPNGLSISAGGVISGTPAVGTHGSRNVTFLVSDGVQTAVSVTLNVVVNPAPMSVTTVALPNGVEGTAYTATLQGTGGSGSMIWSMASGSNPLPSGLTLSAAGVISGTPAINNQSAGTRTFSVRVTDGTLAPATASLSITIALRPLLISTTSIAGAMVGQSYSATLAATGGTGSFTWSVAGGSAAQLPSNLNLSAGGGSIFGTPAVGTHGSYPITFQVSDGVQAPVTTVLTLVVTPASLTVTTNSLPNGTEGSAYSATLAASGGTGGHTWALDGSSAPLPSGITISAAGVIAGTPASGGLSNGTYTVTAKVTDSSSSTATKALQLVIGLPTLVINTTSLPNGVEGTAYNATLSASGGTGSFTWTLSATTPLPTGLSMSAAGVISGTPAINNASAGTRSLTFTVSNPIQSPVSTTLSMTIALRPLQITTTTLSTGTEGASYVSSLVATGGTGTYLWAVGPGNSLPSGLTLAASSGIISGTPATGGLSFGTRQINFVVSDGNSNTNVTIGLTINLSAVSITTTTLPSGVEGTAYSASVAATGGTGNYTFSLSASSLPLPTGLAISANGTVSGTPAINNQSAGVRNIHVQVSDGVQTPTTAFVSITIALQGITIATSALPTAVEGTAYSQSLAATGGTGTYTWSLAAGSVALPSGITLSPAGVLGGTPGSGGISAGTYNLNFQASSGAATPVTKILPLVIQLQPLAITTETLPAGTEGSPYSATLASTGGAAIKVWSLAAGSPALPTGLSLSASTGAITGTPAGNGQSFGTRSILVQVSSGAAAPAVRSLSLTINLTPIQISTVTLPNGTEGSTYSASLAATGGTGTYTWSIAPGSSSLPSGLTLNVQTGAITGTPATNGASHGTRNIVFRANDGIQPNVSATLALTIALQPVQVITTSLPMGTEGTLYNTVLSASGGTGNFTWSVNGATGLPNGLTLSPSGVISGTPATNGGSHGTRSITFSVSDGVQTPVTASLNLVIQLTALSITTSTIPNGTEGQGYSATLSAVGGTGTYTWSLAATSVALPNGVTLSPSGVLSGTLALGGQSAGTHQLVIQVSDGVQAPVSRPYTMTVALSALVIQPIQLANAFVGQPYSAQLGASGGTGSYSWSNVATGSLPVGLSLNAQTGAISGSAQAGTQGQRSVTFTVNDGNSSQSVTTSLLVISPPTITTASLPNARVGEAYSFTLAAIGGTVPRTFTVAAATPLPAGLTMTAAGVISGTPTATGTTTIGFTVADPLSSGSKSLTLVVEPASNLPMVVNAGPSRTLGYMEFDSQSGFTVAGLNGSAIDPDGPAPAVLWTLVSGPASGNLTIFAPTSAVTALAVVGTEIVAGSYVFRLTATEAVTNNTQSSTTTVIVISPVLIPPTAHAGIPQSVTVGTQVTLSGAESSDPDNATPGSLTYAWTVLSQPTNSNVALQTPTNVRPKFTPTVPGTYVFELKVRDLHNLESLAATVTITALPAQTVTLARATANFTFTDADTSGGLNVGETVSLNGAAQYAGPMSEVSFMWSQIGGPSVVTFTNPAVPTQSFTAAAAGNYTFRLAVTANSHAGISADLTVAVAPVGSAPPVAMAAISATDDPDNDMAILFIPGMGVAGETTNPTIDLVSDGSTTGATYSWRQTAGPTAMTTGSNTATLSVTPMLSRVYSFELTVTDANNVSATANVSFAVNTFDPNLNPTGNSVPVASATGTAGTSEVTAQANTGVSLLGQVSDLNNPNANFIFLWVQISGPPVVLDLTNPAAPTFVPPVPGIYTFQLFVDDGDDIGLPSTVTVNALTAVPPSPDTPDSSTGSSSCSVSQGTAGSGMAIWMLMLAALLGVVAIRRRRTNA